jgi:ketosteroid isomerase-like protein
MADHPNVAQLKKGYDAFGSGNLDALRELFAGDIVWHVPGNNPLSGDYKGQDEVFALFMRIFEETGGTFKLEIHDLLANDTHSVALVKASATRKGKALEQNQVNVFHTNDKSQVTEFWALSEDSAAVDAFWS